MNHYQFKMGEQVEASPMVKLVEQTNFQSELKQLKVPKVNLELIKAKLVVNPQHDVKRLREELLLIKQPNY